MMHLLPLLLVVAFAADDKPLSFDVTLSAGKHARANEPVGVPLPVPAGKSYAAKLTGPDGKEVEDTVLLSPRMAAEGGRETVELWFVLPKLEAGKTATYRVELIEGARLTAGIDTLRWKQEKDHAVLSRGKVPVLRYEHAPLDEKNREATFKVFHHVYSPEGALLTKGVGGQFTHHRGLFYGFMKTTYGKHTVDIWHCKGQTHQAHQKVLDETPENAVVGRHRVRIDWNGVGGKTFAVEERELAAFPLPGGTLIEFTSKLTPTEGEVKVDGDPQHAGFHFRASNEVAERQAAYDRASRLKEPEKKAEALKKVAVGDLTHFIRPSGVGKPGTEVNWPGNKKHVDLPWLGMSFVVGGQRYTAAYLDHPSNPKEARYSERAYGRFGSYFVTTATKERPLLVRYRVWVQKGAMKGEELAALSRSFVEPVVVKATRRP